MVEIGALATVLFILVTVGATDPAAEGGGADKQQKVSPPPLPVLLPNPPPPVPLKPELNQADKGQLESGGLAAVPPPPSVAGKIDEGKKGDDISSGDPKSEVGCEAVAEKCHASELVACLQYSGDVSKELFLLVQNEGKDSLIVNIKTSLNSDTNKLQVARHSAEKASVLTNATDVKESIRIILNAGKEDCIIEIKPSVSDWKRSQQFLAYATNLTPIHGLYFLFLIVFIVVGAWAFCKLKRMSRRGDSGIPYQQLEMGTQLQSSSVVADTNTAVGWDESWGDDWDEEEGVGGPSEKHSTANVSSDGLSSKPPSKDGWDVDWDD